MEKKIPLRRCCGCMQSRPKKELLRILKTPEGTILVDPTGRANGRGAYLCRTVSCLHKAVKAKSLERSLKCSVSSDVFELLEKEMKQLE